MAHIKNDMENIRRTLRGTSTKERRRKCLIYIFFTQTSAKSNLRGTLRKYMHFSFQKGTQHTKIGLVYESMGARHSKTEREGLSEGTRNIHVVIVLPVFRGRQRGE